MGLEIRLTVKLLGLVLLSFSLSLLPSLLVALWMAEPIWPWLVSLPAIALPGLLLWGLNYRVDRRLKTRDGFLITALVWLTLCAAATGVLWLGFDAQIALVDLVFEAVSGLTTTGATVMTGLDDMPRSLLLYRQMLQWIGGMGVLVLAVAILPALEIGGMQLRKEIADISVGESLTLPSRFKHQARWLLKLYLGLTALCMLAYWLAGMEPFEAVAHGFSTVAIGGFSTRDDSIGYFNSYAIEWVCMLFMLLATVNFALHFSMLRHRRLGLYIQDAEFSFFLRWLLLVCGAVAALLIVSAGWQDGQSLQQGLFQAVSFATTTGFTTAPRADWPLSILLILVFIACIGGCSGSMSGGIKCFRALIFLHCGQRELKSLVHPNAVIPIKMGAVTVSDKALRSLWGFLAIWLLTFAGLYIATLAAGMEPFTAFSAVAACLTNLGPGQGEVTSHYGAISPAAKWVLSAAMLLGRLEIFTLLVLFTPAFWRR